MSRSAVLVVCVSLAAVLALSACGSDAKKTKTVTPQQAAILTFYLKASNVCAETNKITDPLKPKRLSDIGKAAGTLAPAGSAQIVALRTLTPPANLRDGWLRMLQLLQGQVDLLRDVQTAQAQHKPKAQVLTIVKALNDSTIQGEQLAQALRRPTCGT